MNKPQQPQPSAYVRRGMAAQRAFWGGRRSADMSIDEMCELAAGTGRTASQQAEVDQYNTQVATWNAWVRATRQAKKVQAQTRKNAAEVRAVRAQACPVCFASHPGEC